MPSPPSEVSPLLAPQIDSYSGNHNPNNNGIVGNGDRNVVNSGNNNQFNIIQNIPAEDELDRLICGHVSKDALRNHLNSPPECYPETRKTVRKEIRGWIDNGGSAKSPLLWLNGPAGVGKSVIAKTISAHPQVVATFFFSTTSDTSGATLFPTLAWQLARRIPETREHILTSLKESGSLLTSQLEEQFDLLLVQPLQKCTMMLASTPVMVIDGVDECIDESMLERFLRVLERTGKRGDMPLRFIICSRPEHRIRDILGKLCDESTTAKRVVPQNGSNRDPTDSPNVLLQFRTWIQSYLHTITQWKLRGFARVSQEALELYRPMRLGVDRGDSLPEIHSEHASRFDRIRFHRVVSSIEIGFSEESRADIARYLTDRFNAIRPHGEDTNPECQQSDISDLVERSCGQFLYASTIVRLLDDGYSSEEVLKMVRCSSLPTPDLNKLYKVILDRAKAALRKQAKEGGPGYQTELGILKDTLAILVIFADNIQLFSVRENVPLIENLLDLKGDQLTTKFRKLHSVINIEPRKSIRVHHRSFLEFLRSQERSGEYYIAYPNALQRFLILSGRAVLGFHVVRCCRQLR